MKRRTKLVLSIFAILIIFVWANNTSLFARPSGKMKFLAHRGLVQNFDISKVESNTNTAAMIYEPEYPYIENTIETMRAAYEYGADCVELDIQLSKDGQLACLDDYTLEYRTNGKGEISDYTMDELKRLDIGYGYTADGGKTYPFRGLGMDIMIQAVLAYEAIGWTGYVPPAIRNTELHLPIKYAKLLWGWPKKFVKRMELVNTRVVVVNGNGKWSEGLAITISPFYR